MRAAFTRRCRDYGTLDIHRGLASAAGRRWRWSLRTLRGRSTTRDPRAARRHRAPGRYAPSGATLRHEAGRHQHQHDGGRPGRRARFSGPRPDHATPRRIRAARLPASARPADAQGSASPRIGPAASITSAPGGERHQQTPRRGSWCAGRAPVRASRRRPGWPRLVESERRRPGGEPARSRSGTARVAGRPGKRGNLQAAHHDRHRR